MEPPMNNKSSAVPINTTEEGVELEDEKKMDVLVKRRRTEFSGSTVQPQRDIEVSDMEISGEANGFSKGHVRGISFRGNEPARLRLPKICTAIGWKEPSFDFEELGPPHNKLFTCKVTVHLDGLVSTVMECFGDPKPKKKAAQEHAAQGALWCLEHFGRGK